MLFQGGGLCWLSNGEADPSLAGDSSSQIVAQQRGHVWPCTKYRTGEVLSCELGHRMTVLETIIFDQWFSLECYAIQYDKTAGETGSSSDSDASRRTPGKLGKPVTVCRTEHLTFFTLHHHHLIPCSLVQLLAFGPRPRLGSSLLRQLTEQKLPFSVLAEELANLYPSSSKVTLSSHL